MYMVIITIWCTGEQGKDKSFTGKVSNTSSPVVCYTLGTGEPFYVLFHVFGVQTQGWDYTTTCSGCRLETGLLHQGKCTLTVGKWTHLSM